MTFVQPTHNEAPEILAELHTRRQDLRILENMVALSERLSKGKGNNRSYKESCNCLHQRMESVQKDIGQLKASTKLHSIQK